MFVHIFAVGLPLLVIWVAQPGTSLFSWHPTLMAVSFGFLMVEAIAMFSPLNSLILSSPRATKVKFHWILQTAAVITALGGFAAIYQNKNMNNEPHFKSWHGLLGLFTVILTCLQSLQGIGVLYSYLPLAMGMHPSQLKQLHAMSGLLLLIVSCFTLALGFFSNWFLKNSGVYIVFLSLNSLIAISAMAVCSEFLLQTTSIDFKSGRIRYYSKMQVIFYYSFFFICFIFFAVAYYETIFTHSSTYFRNTTLNYTINMTAG